MARLIVMASSLRFSCASVLLLLACGDTHTTGLVDAGPGDDAFVADAFTTDAGREPDDAGADAGPVPLACDAEVVGMAGEGCFCQGAIAIDGDTGYRLGFDLEVHDLSGGGAVEVARVPVARATAEGALALHGDTLFVGTRGLEVFDVRERRAPRALTFVDFEPEVADMVMLGTTLWLVHDTPAGGMLRGYDVSDPAEPTSLAALSLVGRPGSVLVHGDRLVVVEEHRSAGSDGPDRASIIDVAGRPFVAADVELEGRGVLRRRAAIADGILHVVGVEPMLQVVDLEAGRVVGVLASPDPERGLGLGVSVADGVALVSGDGLQLADVRDPARPRWAGSAAVPSSSHHVVRRGDDVFLGTGNQLIRVRLRCE